MGMRGGLFQLMSQSSSLFAQAACSLQLNFDSPLGLPPVASCLCHPYPTSQLVQGVWVRDLFYRTVMLPTSRIHLVLAETMDCAKREGSLWVDQHESPYVQGVLFLLKTC